MTSSVHDKTFYCRVFYREKLLTISQSNNMYNHNAPGLLYDWSNKYLISVFPIKKRKY